MITSLFLHKLELDLVFGHLLFEPVPDFDGFEQDQLLCLGRLPEDGNLWVRVEPLVLHHQVHLHVDGLGDRVVQVKRLLVLLGDVLRVDGQHLVVQGLVQQNPL